MTGAKFLLLCGVSAILAGCSSLGLSSGEKSSAGSQETAASSEGAVLGPLVEASLPKGECGMILWTLDEDRPAPVFRYLSGKTAEIVLNSAPISLRRMETFGTAAFGVAESQTFVGEGGVKVSVDVRFSLGFDGGSYLERGLIKVETADGWNTVAPSAGLAGCRSK